jgi:hypothetical protein
MISILQKGTLGSVASLLAATLYQGIPDRNHKLWIIVSSERYPYLSFHCKVIKPLQRYLYPSPCIKIYPPYL